MKEKYYEYSDQKGKCKYDLAVMENCRECLFNVLCNLEKWNDTHEVEQTS